MGKGWFAFINDYLPDVISRCFLKLVAHASSLQLKARKPKNI
jgi:hypothetical protein